MSTTSESTKPMLGYRRPNGTFGVRNHVLILPVDDLSNAACLGVANNIRGTMALPHPYGRLQYGDDLQLHFDTLIGTGRNPNAGAVVVIGIEPTWTKRIVDGIASTGKPVAGFHIERTGDIGTVATASRQAKEFVHLVSEQRREEFDWKDITVSIKCGESDTTSGLGSNPAVGQAVDRLIEMGTTVLFGETSELTGGEHLIARRCATPELREEFTRTFND
ncbi:MAG: UxaA family hydrolase, partial [Chloroflexota bacterium]